MRGKISVREKMGGEELRVSFDVFINAVSVHIPEEPMDV